MSLTVQLVGAPLLLHLLGLMNSGLTFVTMRKAKPARTTLAHFKAPLVS